MYVWCTHPWSWPLMYVWCTTVWWRYPWSWSPTFMILVPDPDACMNVWCMYLWSMMGLKFCHERTNKTISGVGWLVLLLSSAHISSTLLGPCLCVFYSESYIQRALCREILMTSINHIWVKIIYGGKSNRRLQYTAFRVLVLVKHKARQRKEASLRF